MNGKFAEQVLSVSRCGAIDSEDRCDPPAQWVQSVLTCAAVLVCCRSPIELSFHCDQIGKTF